MNPSQIPCPHCKAGRGAPCVIPGTRLTLRLMRFHPSRAEAAGLPDPGPAAVALYRQALDDAKHGS